MHSVVQRRQLIELGLGAAAIDHRVRAGLLLLLYRGVYAVGHRARLREAGLPRSVTGYEIGRYTADFAWPAERVVVETRRVGLPRGAGAASARCW